MVLVLPALACRSVQVGVVTPTSEANMQPINEGQEPEPEPTATEGVENPTEIVSTPKPASKIPTMAFIGPDGNIWVLNAGSEKPHQVTFDAKRSEGDSAEIVYLSPLLSSDSTL